MKRHFVPILILIFFSFCKKKSDAPLAVKDYLPLTVGTNWTYTSSGNIYKLTVTNKDTVALGRTYKVLSSSDGGPNQYQTKAGNDYFRFATFQGFIPNGVEELYLKEDQNVNSTWQFSVPITFSGVPINVTAKYTITEKGITKIVQGKTYNDVFHIRQDFSSLIGNHGGGDHFYAKGVGLISSNLNITLPTQTITNTTELVSTRSSNRMFLIGKNIL